MTMYAGTAGNLTELLSALRFHAENEGWITRRAGSGFWFGESPVAGHFSFQVVPDGSVLEMCANRGYEPANSVLNQPGSSAQAVNSDAAGATWFQPNHLGPYSRYVAFVTPQYVHCVLEILDGIFGHLAFGMLDKQGEPSGHGQYVQATRWRQPHSSGASWTSPTPAGGFWTEGNENPGRLFTGGVGHRQAILWERIRTAVPGLGTLHPDSSLIGASLNSVFSRRLPMPVRVLSGNPDTRRYLLGQVADFALVNNADMFAGETIIMGQDVWHVFPAYRVSSRYAEGSGFTGFAYRTKGENT